MNSIETASTSERSTSLSGKIAVVVGAGGRLGSAICDALASQGASLALVDVNQSALDRVQAQLPAQNVHGAHVVDFGDAEAVEAFLTSIAPVDHIVVAASSPPVPGDLTVTDLAGAKASFARMWVSFNAVHNAPAVMAPDGSVTLLSGSSGRRPIAGYGVWGTLHGSIEALAKSAALELAPIRVNIVSPGGIAMSPHEQLVDRVGQPEDIADAVVAVIKNRAMTSAVIDVDSGERLGSWGDGSR